MSDFLVSGFLVVRRVFPEVQTCFLKEFRRDSVQVGCLEAALGMVVNEGDRKDFPLVRLREGHINTALGHPSFEMELGSAILQGGHSDIDDALFLPGLYFSPTFLHVRINSICIRITDARRTDGRRAVFVRFRVQADEVH